MSFSTILDNVDNIGLKLFIILDEPDLKIGVTLAYSRISGKMSTNIEELKRLLMVFDIKLFKCL